MTGFKATVTDLDLPANALRDLNIDGDSTSDEYDFMDDVEGPKDSAQRRNGFREPRRKYMDLLQDVADRKTNEILIELDDIDNVRSIPGGWL